MKTKILYGAGNAAFLFLSRQDKRALKKIAAIITDQSTNATKQIFNIPVISTQTFLEKLNTSFAEVETIILAMPSVSIKRKLELLANLPSHLSVETLPSVPVLASETKALTELIKIDNIFGKSKLSLFNIKSLSNVYQNKIVLVTGGGGSIGSEVCIQLSKIGVKKLIVIDSSEFNLFRVRSDIENLTKGNGLIAEYVLGSVCDKELLESIYKTCPIDVVIHCAAYKHVGILEHQPRVALINNVLGTYFVAKKAADYGVSNFILVSTDKAVKPSSIMGKTKRICELIVNQIGQQYKTTIFQSVRFGNVIGSSGSVVPIFEKNLLEGRSLELTDPNVTRFFMSISDAASLILQVPLIKIRAGLEAVYFLDMGAPKSIKKLAETAINLFGKSATYDTKSSKPDEVLIRITGLKKGEKMHEELTYAENTLMTEIDGIRQENVNQIIHDELIKNMATISRDKNSARISNEDSIMLINKWLGE